MLKNGIVIFFYINDIVFKNTKIEIQPILSYGGSFPSHLVRTVKLRVRISSVTDAVALRRGYRALSNASPSTPLE